MKSTRIRSIREQHGLLIGGIVLTVICVAWLLLLPFDSRDRLIAGVSLKRWLMAALFILPSLALAGLAALAARRASLRTRLNALLVTDGFGWAIFFVVAALSIFLMWTVIDTPHALEAFLSNLRPAIAWYTVMAAGLAVLHYRARRVILPLASRHAYLWGVLLFSVSLILWNAFRYPLPLGYAGLYSLMANLLATHNFLPPWQVPFYGPAGIPFAYPPLGFYLMALATRLPGLSDLDYLRFAPPLFLIASCLALAVLARRQTGSSLAGFLAGIFMAANARSFFAQGQAAGMVRGVALAVALLGLVFFEGAIRQRARKPAILAGLCFGLVLLAHPAYALFFALSAFCLGLVPVPGRPLALRWRIEQGLLTALTGLLLSAPWWGLIIARYGLPVLGNILGSHDNLSLLTVFDRPLEVIDFIGTTILKIARMPLIAGGALLGMGVLLARRDFRLPVWLVVVTLMNPSEDRFIFMVACILAAGVIAALVESAAKSPALFNGQGSAPRVFVVLIVALVWLLGWYGLRWQAPAIEPETVQVGAWFQAQTPPAATFLVITALPDEAEWFPYLLQRTPVLGSWGAEWLGTYNDQLSLVSHAKMCADQQSLPCVQDLVSKLNPPPEYLITRQDQKYLNLQIGISTPWKVRYTNAIYQVRQLIAQP